MSFSTNPTNPLSAYNMTSNNLTAGNLRNARSEGANRNAYSSSSSESDDEVKVTARETFIKKKEITKCQQQQKNRAPTKLEPERRFLLTKDIKPLPNRKSSFSLKNFFLSFCCTR